MDVVTSGASVYCSHGTRLVAVAEVSRNCWGGTAKTSCTHGAACISFLIHFHRLSQVISLQLESE